MGMSGTTVGGVVGGVAVMSAGEAGRLAAELRTPCLLLGRCVPRLHDLHGADDGRPPHDGPHGVHAVHVAPRPPRGALAAAAAAEARDALMRHSYSAAHENAAGLGGGHVPGGARVDVVHDFWVHVIEKHDGPDPPLAQQA